MCMAGESEHLCPSTTIAIITTIWLGAEGCGPLLKSSWVAPGVGRVERWRGVLLNRVQLYELLARL